MASRIKKGDTVVVIAGSSKGRTGRVLEVDVRNSRVLVEGVNISKKHIKKQGDQAGRIVEKEASVHISNVALWDTEKGKRRKVRIQRDESGQAVRVDRKTGDQV